MNRKRDAIFIGIGIFAGLALSGPAVPPAPTEESVRATLAQLRETYPTGTVYPTPYHSISGPYRRGTHCSGWATLYSDTAFGSLPWHESR